MSYSTQSWLLKVLFRCTSKSSRTAHIGFDASYTREHLIWLTYNIKLSTWATIMLRHVHTCLGLSSTLWHFQSVITGRHVTVYHMIWATKRTHCVIWYGFSEFIEPLNNIVKWLTLPYDMIQWIQWMSMDICLALHHCQGLEWPSTDAYQ